ncbi:MAG: LysE family transporter, partial [Fibrobacteres bacterium]|nr:LysE family transporter [Fibrobacterota bacterium]
SFRAEPPIMDGERNEARSYFKGMIVNFLSPNPYLFWLTVGAPTTIKAWKTNPVNAIVFLMLFYVCLIAGKMALAFISGKARSFLTGRGYTTVMRVLALLLIFFAITLIRDGFKLL